MSVITAILEPDAQGTLHLQLPPDYRRVKFLVTAREEAPDKARPTSAEALAALRKLQALGTFRRVKDRAERQQ